MARKIASVADLNALKAKAQGDVDLRSGAKEIEATVHMGTCGIAAGARDVLAEFLASPERRRPRHAPPDRLPRACATRSR